MKKIYKGFVYEWTNIINNKKYIGSHKGDENDGYIGSGIIFKKAVKKYGIENFIRQIYYKGVKYREIEDKLLKETDAANNPMYYNMKNEAIGGAFYSHKNGMYGKHHKKESLEKISKTAKQNYTQERKEKHSNDIKGSKNGTFGKNSHTYGLINRMKNFEGKSYEEIFGNEKSNMIKDKLSKSHKGRTYNMIEVQCPYCGLIGKGGNMTRYHFNNCKLKNKNENILSRENR